MTQISIPPQSAYARTRDTEAPNAAPVLPLRDVLAPGLTFSDLLAQQQTQPAPYVERATAFEAVPMLGFHGQTRAAHTASLASKDCGHAIAEPLGADLPLATVRQGRSVSAEAETPRAASMASQAPAPNGAQPLRASNSAAASAPKTPPALNMPRPQNNFAGTPETNSIEAPDGAQHRAWTPQAEPAATARVVIYATDASLRIVAPDLVPNEKRALERAAKDLLTRRGMDHAMLNIVSRSHSQEGQ